MAFQKAASLSDLKADEVTGVSIAESSVALYLIDGQPFATSDLCTHEECPLSEEGEVVGNEVHCLCHGSKFDIRTGAVIDPPATEPLPTYAVELRGQDVYVDLG
ncbi:MAG TPA: non-heme iron oxygenase ferredoxin subunit [Dehalococcoidia bacterium]|jgi:3-phenylpropionate/trans-cinnamate dioxygenase ferredoxin subunit|nr:non-heme iron oxygenase ferredoxin subunit [Dehalococcoidia bacterium]